MKTTFALIAGVVLIVAAAFAQNPKPQQAAPTGVDQAQDADAMSNHMRMMNEMMVKHLGQKDPDFEKRFVDLMIPHHEGAVVMAKTALAGANRPELKDMAQKMIEMQEKEIVQLKQWRQKWYPEQ